MTGHVQKYVVDYIMERLSSRKKRRVREHLRDCPQCRQFYKAINQLFAPPEGIERFPLEPDPFLVTRIREWETTPKKNRFSERPIPGGLRWSPWGILVSVALLVGIFIARFTNQMDWESHFIVSQVQETLNFGDDMLTESTMEPFVNSKIEIHP